MENSTSITYRTTKNCLNLFRYKQTQTTTKSFHYKEKKYQTFSHIKIQHLKFKKLFEGFYDRYSLKVAPTGFDKNHPNINLIKKKDFVVICRFTDKEVLSKEFYTRVIDAFGAVRPLFNYMSDVLTTNLNGESILE